MRIESSMRSSHLNSGVASEDLAKRIRVKCLYMTHQASASHIASSLSIADILAVLYGNVMNIKSTDPEWSQRDRFILSKGHACSAIYATLAEVGYFNNDRLKSFGADHSDLMTHVSHRVPGVEFSTGSLGHGLPFGAGKALVAHRLKLDWQTFVLLSDGELGEGSNWEAMMFASHHQLDNLIAIVDYNKLQSLATVNDTLRVEPLVDKVLAFGWAVREIDGHNHTQLTSLLGSAPWEPGKPSFLIAHTTKGKGVSFMENSVDWHYKSPSTEQLAQALWELNHA